jgi:hypothetical protein
MGSLAHENKSPQIINVNSARLHENEKSTIRDKVFHLRERMGHPPEDVMCIAIDGENPTWINATVATKQIRKVFFAREPCLACVIGKRNHDSGRYHLYRLKHKDDKPDKDVKPTEILKPENEKSDQDPKPTIMDEEVIIDASKIDLHIHPPGECISADVIPTISPKSIENDIGYYAFTDVETGHLLVYPMRNKTSESFIQALTLVIRFYKRYGIDIKYLRTDRVSDLISEQVDAFL